MLLEGLFFFGYKFGRLSVLRLDFLFSLEVSLVGTRVTFGSLEELRSSFGAPLGGFGWIFFDPFVCEWVFDLVAIRVGRELVFWVW